LQVKLDYDHLLILNLVSIPFSDMWFKFI